MKSRKQRLWRKGKANKRPPPHNRNVGNPTVEQLNAEECKRCTWHNVAEGQLEHLFFHYYLVTTFMSDIYCLEEAGKKQEKDMNKSLKLDTSFIKRSVPLNDFWIFLPKSRIRVTFRHSVPSMGAFEQLLSTGSSRTRLWLLRSGLLTWMELPFWVWDSAHENLA